MIPDKTLNIWFSRVRDGFARALIEEFAGKPIAYLEVGCWGGASAEWVCKNLLTHPKSFGIGVDPYPPNRICDCNELKALAAERLAFMGDRWKWVYELSSDSGIATAGKLAGRKFDLVYIDGCHAGSAVYLDFAAVWPLLKIGSVIVFDDYWHKRSSKELWPHVRDAAVGIQLAFAGMLERIEGLDKRQMGFRVLRKCLPKINEREDAMEALGAEEHERQKRIRKAVNWI
jgi:hypothetical protein